MIDLNTVHHADALDFLGSLDDGSVNCCVTSPPYFGLRDYGVDGQMGLEPTPAEYVASMVRLFSEVKRVLRDDGTCWINLGDSYASGEVGRHDSVQGRVIDGKPVTSKATVRQQSKVATGLRPKSLVGIPWRVAFGLQDDGWILRSDIIWAKPNPMPESVTDRPTKAHEYIFLLSKSESYWYDADAIREPAEYGRREGTNWSRVRIGDPRDSRDTLPTTTKGGDPEAGRNKRSVWTVPTFAFPSAHFATFPPELIRPMILAGCPVGGVVLDPFMGSGTTGLVARQLGRNFVGCDLNPEYVAMANERLRLPFSPRAQRGSDFAGLPLFERAEGE